MVELGILEPCGASEWASPAFIIPRKDGCVQQITDLYSLNKAIICKQYPLPIITNMLDWISGYKFFTKLDISCNTTCLNLTNQTKSSASLLCPLANTNTNISPWDSNMHQTLPSKLWKKFYTMLKTLVSTTMILVLFFHLGTPHFTSWQNPTLVGSQQLHHQSTQMKMGHSRNWLAWLLAHTHWFEALAQKNWWHLTNAKTKNLLQMSGFLDALNHYRHMWPQHVHILAPLFSESGKKTIC